MFQISIISIQVELNPKQKSSLFVRSFIYECKRGANCSNQQPRSHCLNPNTLISIVDAIRASTS